LSIGRLKKETREYPVTPRVFARADAADYNCIVCGDEDMQKVCRRADGLDAVSGYARCNVPQLYLK